MKDRRTRSIREERGLVGKIIVIWLLVMVVLGLAAFVAIVARPLRLPYTVALVVAFAPLP